MRNNSVQWYRAMVTISRLVLLLLVSPFPTLACEKLIVSANASNAPISFNNNGNLTGIGIELFRRLIIDLKTPIEVTQPYPWRRALRISRQGGIDIIIGVRKTAKRQQFLDFIEPAFTNTAHSIFFKKNKKGLINSKEDLKQLHGGLT